LPAKQKISGTKVKVSKYSTTYQTGKNTFKQVISAIPNTYTDSFGKEQQYNNILVKDKANLTSYTSKSSDLKVDLPQKISANDGVSIAENNKGADNKKVELIPQGGDFSNSQVLENAIRYNNVFDGIDYQYTVSNIGIKEDVILNQYVDQNEFTYELKTNGLTAKLENGIINIYNKDQVLYTIEAPVMTDSNGVMNTSIQLGLTEDNGKQYIKVTADKKWLSDASRVFPVKIDPTINHVSGSADSGAYFTTVEQVAPDTAIGDINFTYCGYEDGTLTGLSGGLGITRLYAKINVSSIPQDSVINSATYTLYQRTKTYTSVADRMTIGLYSMSSNWGGTGTRTYNNQPPSSSLSFVDSAQVGAVGTVLSFDITSLVNDWVQGVLPNYGMCFKAQNETTMQAEIIGSPKYAENQSNPMYAPTFTINYTLNNPVDPNYPINNLTVNLRPMSEKDTTGKQALGRSICRRGVNTGKCCRLRSKSSNSICWSIYCKC